MQQGRALRPSRPCWRLGLSDSAPCAGGRQMPDRGLVVVPTYNERENLPQIVPRILATDPRLDVLVVDDGSPDGTGAIADGLAAADPRVHVLHRSTKEGLGRAYLAGFEWALQREYAWVFEMDADFSHDPKYLLDLLRKIEEADL